MPPHSFSGGIALFCREIEPGKVSQLFLISLLNRLHPSPQPVLPFCYGIRAFEQDRHRRGWHGADFANRIAPQNEQPHR